MIGEKNKNQDKKKWELPKSPTTIDKKKEQSFNQMLSFPSLCCFKMNLTHINMTNDQHRIQLVLNK